MTADKCPDCGWAHSEGAPCIRLGDAQVTVWGAEPEGIHPAPHETARAALAELPGAWAVPVPSAEAVTEILQDYLRLHAKEAERKAKKAASMRGYRASVAKKKGR